MPWKNAAGLFPVGFLSLVLLVTAFLWPHLPARAEARTAGDTVRVCIAQQMPEVRLNFQGHYRLVDTGSGQIIAETGDGQTWTLTGVGGFLVLDGNGNSYGVFKNAVRAEEINVKQSILSGDGILLQKDSVSGLAVLSGDSGVRYIDGTEGLRALDGSGLVNRLSRGGVNLFGLEKNSRTLRYRGNVEVKPVSSGLTVINELSIEHYLYGVVPGEMPTSFPLEALKAQAVAARSYLLSQLGNNASRGYDVLDNQSNQIYRGYDGEHAQTTRAVSETAGKVLVYRDQPIIAFFHSSSGGYTENSEDVWQESLGYIRAREDKADLNDRHYNWTVSYSADQLTRAVNERLKSLNQGSHPQFSSIVDLKEVQYTSSGQRVKRLLIEGYDTAGNPVQVSINNADRVRAVLGLNSALFTVQKDTAAGGGLSGVIITGSGMGHGLGMSQYGARGLALEGYNYQDILQYYYTDVDLVNNYGF